MDRRHRRVSRGLIALLLVVVVIGGVFYFHNTGKTIAREPAPTVHEPLASEIAHTPDVAVRATSPTPAVATQPTATVFISSTPDLASPTTAPSATLATQPSDALAQGFVKKSSGDFLAARQLLNSSLKSSELSGDEVRRCKAAIAEINQTVLFSPKRFPTDEYGGAYTVRPGELMRKIADAHDITWELICRINNISDPKKLRAGQTIKIINGPFHAVVNKHDFTMDLYLGGAPREKGSMYVTSFNVGLGAENSTPTGVWLVEPQKKIKNPVYYSPRGEGVIDADDPKNPLGERWIGLTGIDGQAVGKESYGIHGTIEPETIGKMASMGCIRLRNEDVERLYEMLVEGKSTVEVRE